MTSSEPLVTPATSPAPQPAPAADPGALLFEQYTKDYGMYLAGQYGQFVRELPHTAYLVDGLLPACSVNILVGDSGIGKSALAYQLALSAAAGKPFLGMPTRKSKVVIVDYENSPVDSHWMLEQQRKHLGLVKYPGASLIVWPVQNCPSPDLTTSVVEKIIRQFAADLVILDSLRSFSPEMEKENSIAAEQIKRLRVMTTRHGTAVLLVHHVRKHGVLNRASLEEGHVLDWLLRSAGTRALINQTDVRLAAALPANGSGDLVLRGHCRTRGEIGPFVIARKWDDIGEPTGYDRVEATLTMLDNLEQESAFLALGESFHFKEARMVYGKRSQATTLFLAKLIRLGLAQKIVRGQYRKVVVSQNSGLTPETACYQ
jgi:KaiC/GvpD/RAD55 family RecA-like ATPase